MLVLLLAGACLAIGLLGFWLDAFTDASFAYWDSATTVLSLLGMWMTARKYIENWLLWVIVDAISLVLYAEKGLPLYCALYTIYLGMAVLGFRRWHAAMMAPQRVRLA